MQLEINDIQLNCEKIGEGHPVILIHGSGEDHHIFDKLTERLKNNFTVYAFDSRNHGLSTKTDDYTYESMAEDYSQAIKLLGLEKPYLVGFSDGAIIGVIIETLYPNTFGKMALLGINLQPSDFKDEILQYLEAEYAETKDPLLGMMLTQPSISLSQLEQIGTASLLVFAEDDLFKSEMIDSILESMPDSTSKIVEGHDHGSYIINEDILYPDLMQFFDDENSL